MDKAAHLEDVIRRAIRLLDDYRDDEAYGALVEGLGEYGGNTTDKLTLRMNTFWRSFIQKWRKGEFPGLYH